MALGLVVEGGLKEKGREERSFPGIGSKGYVLRITHRKPPSIFELAGTKFHAIIPALYVHFRSRRFRTPWVYIASHPERQNHPLPSSKQIILKLHPLTNRQHDRRLRPDAIHRRLEPRLVGPLQLELVALRVPGPPSPVYVHVVGPIGLLQPVEGTVAVGGFAQRGGAVAGGGGFGAVGPAPDDADEEGPQGREAGGYDGYGGFGGGPDGGGDVVPCCACVISVCVGFVGRGLNLQVMSSLLPYLWSTMRRVTLTAHTLGASLV